MKLKSNIKITDALALLFIGSLWGINWPAVKFLLTSIEPLTMRAVSFTAAALMLAVIARGLLKNQSGRNCSYVAQSILAGSNKISPTRHLVSSWLPKDLWEWLNLRFLKPSWRQRCGTVLELKAMIKGLGFWRRLISGAKVTGLKGVMDVLQCFIKGQTQMKISTNNFVPLCLKVRGPWTTHLLRGHKYPSWRSCHD
jgi:hypothetical protein